MVLYCTVLPDAQWVRIVPPAMMHACLMRSGYALCNLACGLCGTYASVVGVAYVAGVAAGCRMQGVECRVQNAGCRMQNMG